MRKLILFLFTLLLPFSANATTCTGATYLYSSNVPDGYTELEYIESTGTQWINTEIRQFCSSDLEIEFSFKPTQLGGFMLGNAYTQTNIDTGNGFSVGTTGITKVTYSGTFERIYYNDVLKTTLGWGSCGFDNLPIALFTLGYYTDSPYVEYWYHTYGAMYYAKIYDNGVLVRNFIPARRDSDGEIGMYDTVSGTFFTNSGTGTFVAGADVGTCETCPAGYACTNGVKTACASVTGPNGRPTYTNDTGGASSCTECPGVSGALSSRLTGYGYYPYTHGTGINGCLADLMDNDPDATFKLTCYYNNTAGVYGGTNTSSATCHAYPPTWCAAGKYNTIESTPEWQSWGATVHRNGIDTMNGRVCTDVGVGYYSPDGDLNRYECTNTKPANSHYSGSGGATNNCPWECDAGYWNDNGVCTQCPAGYYINNGQCVSCENDHYCTGDGTMHACPAIPYNDAQLKQLIESKGFTGVTNAGQAALSTLWFDHPWNNTSIESCAMVVVGTQVTQGTLRVLGFRYDTSTDNYTNLRMTYWYSANPGYYLTGIHPGGDMWAYAKQCTNSHPNNSHYSGAGTPDNLSGTVVDANDCPWTCDAGYYNDNGTCTLCPAGYACTNGVKTNCANVTGPNGRPTYSGTPGASSCTECPAVTGALASRATGVYQYWSFNGVHYTINGCYTGFTDNDPDATFETICYYSDSDSMYGGPNTTCQSYSPTWCAAGKYDTIESTPEWDSYYALCKGVNCMNGKVCTDVGTGYYSPAGDTARYACTNKPANSTYSASGTSSSCPWTCDTNYWEYSNACHARCPYGDGELHVGEYTHPLWADITNVPSPSVYIGELGPNHDGLCYAYLEPDDTPVDNHHGFHTVHNGVPYHAINLGLYGLE